MTATDAARILALRAAQAAADKLATDIVIIDVADRLPLTDCFVIATGGNERQVGAIVDSVSEQLAAVGAKVVRREGERDGRWVLLDFGDVVVHIQHAEERVFYALDKLWGDCPTLPFADAAAGAAVDVREATSDGAGDTRTDGDPTGADPTDAKD